MKKYFSVKKYIFANILSNCVIYVVCMGKIIATSYYDSRFHFI